MMRDPKNLGEEASFVLVLGMAILLAISGPLATASQGDTAGSSDSLSLELALDEPPVKGNEPRHLTGGLTLVNPTNTTIARPSPFLLD